MAAEQPGHEELAYRVSSGLFHETITYAFLMVINERIVDGDGWEGV
jgi:hypothetical protein